MVGWLCFCHFSHLVFVIVESCVSTTHLMTSSIFMTSCLPLFSDQQLIPDHVFFPAEEISWSTNLPLFCQLGVCIVCSLGLNRTCLFVCVSTSQCARIMFVTVWNPDIFFDGSLLSLYLLLPGTQRCLSWFLSDLFLYCGNLVLVAAVAR